MQYLKPDSLLDLSKTLACPLFEGVKYPWEVLPLIGDFIYKLAESLPQDVYTKAGDGIYIAASAKISDKADITGPCIIGERTEVRPGAYIRGKALVGSDAVVGNSTELKNVVLFDCVQVPHYNYVGDSILGYKAHMGAGSITSNVKADRSPVTILTPSGRMETGLKKMGAILGNFVEIGCNAVLNPGTVVGRSTQIYPLTSVRGYVPPNSIYKTNGQVVEKK